VQRNDGESVVTILGGPSELASSGDASQDRLDREMFAQKYQEMHRLGRDTDGSETLYIGAENWPLPIPLVEKNGTWQFDSVAGLKEVLFRRIGENELTAIETCHALVAAERQFRGNPKTASLADSPFASLLSAAASGSSAPSPSRSTATTFESWQTAEPGARLPTVSASSLTRWSIDRPVL
jgi:hypothetical protein